MFSDRLRGSNRDKRHLGARQSQQAKSRAPSAWPNAKHDPALYVLAPAMSLMGAQALDCSSLGFYEIARGLSCRCDYFFALAHHPPRGHQLKAPSTT